jgi:ribosomal protein S21
MIEVIVRKNNVNKAIAILNKKVREDGDLRRVIERKYHETKSERRRKKMAKAKIRAIKEARERASED